LVSFSLKREHCKYYALDELVPLRRSDHFQPASAGPVVFARCSWGTQRFGSAGSTGSSRPRASLQTDNNPARVAGMDVFANVRSHQLRTLSDHRDRPPATSPPTTFPLSLPGAPEGQLGGADHKASHLAKLPSTRYSLTVTCNSRSPRPGGIAIQSHGGLTIAKLLRPFGDVPRSTLLSQEACGAAMEASGSRRFASLRH